MAFDVKAKEQHHRVCGGEDYRGNDRPRYAADAADDDDGMRPTFSILAACLMIMGVVVTFIVKRVRLVAAVTGDEATPVAYSRGLFLRLMLSFFAMCFVGLAIMANAKVFLQDFQVSAVSAAKGIAIFNLSYLFGSLLGGKVAETVGGRNAVLAALSVQLATLLISGVVTSPLFAWVLTVVAGCALGSTASVFPIYLSQVFGVNASTVLFPRLVIAYGVAGLTSPWIFAVLRSETGDNIAFLLLSTSVTLSALIAFVARTRWRWGKR